MATTFIDTHIHLDAEEFDDDRDEVVARAKETGVGAVFVPAINLPTVTAALNVCRRYPGYAYPMIGLHPEDVKADWQDTLEKMKQLYTDEFIAVGEVGLDYYWSREFENEQLLAFEQQIQWAIEWKKPLMIHCRKAQNEMVKLMRKYEGRMHGGVFHCFTGNEKEAAELLQFEGFAIGIGGVLTFKKSNLPEVVPTIPMDRIVIETDAPYMAPTPMRGKRNESAYAKYVLERMAECYGITPEEMAQKTNENVKRIFGNF